MAWSVRTLLGVLAVGLACEGPPAVDDTPAHRTVRIPQPIAPVDDEDASADLLQGYAGRDMITAKEAATWELPFQSKRLAVALMIIAAHDRLEDLDLVLTPDATWGLPETRRFGARPIFGTDGGEAFLTALRTAATRFPAKAKWQTQPLPAGPQESVRVGAEPLWSFFTNGNDRIYFREVLYGDTARIDYVGMFEELPTEPVQVVGHGRPVPLGPPVRHPVRPDADDDTPDDELEPMMPVPTPDPR